MHFISMQISIILFSLQQQAALNPIFTAAITAMIGIYIAYFFLEIEISTSNILIPYRQSHIRGIADMAFTTAKPQLTHTNGHTFYFSGSS